MPCRLTSSPTQGPQDAIAQAAPPRPTSAHGRCAPTWRKCVRPAGRGIEGRRRLPPHPGDVVLGAGGRHLLERVRHGEARRPQARSIWPDTRACIGWLTASQDPSGRSLNSIGSAASLPGLNMAGRRRFRHPSPCQSRAGPSYRAPQPATGGLSGCGWQSCANGARRKRGSPRRPRRRRSSSALGCTVAVEAGRRRLPSGIPDAAYREAGRRGRAGRRRGAGRRRHRAEGARAARHRGGRGGRARPDPPRRAADRHAAGRRGDGRQPTPQRGDRRLLDGTAAAHHPRAVAWTCCPPRPTWRATAR